MIINVHLYFAAGNGLRYDAVTRWFYLFQDGDRMLGKEKNAGNTGIMIS
jgi:hypothetical protein